MFLKLFFGVNGAQTAMRTALVIGGCSLLGLNAFTDGGPMEISLFILIAGVVAAYRWHMAAKVSSAWNKRCFYPDFHHGWEVAAERHKRLVAFGTMVLPSSAIGNITVFEPAIGMASVRSSSITVEIKGRDIDSVTVEFWDVKSARAWATLLNGI